MATKKLTAKKPKSARKPPSAAAVSRVVGADPYAAPADADLWYILPELRQFAVRADSLNRDAKNLKKHGDKDLPVIQGSLEAWKIYSALIVQKSTRNIVKGNGTHESAMRAGYEYVPVFFYDLTDAQAKALAFSDNATSTVAAWDVALMRDEALVLDGLMKELNLGVLIPDLLAEMDLPSLEQLQAELNASQEPVAAAEETPEPPAGPTPQYLHRLTVVCNDLDDLMKLKARMEEEGRVVKQMPTQQV